MTDLKIGTIGLRNLHRVCVINRCTRYVTLHAVKLTSAEYAARALCTVTRRRSQVIAGHSLLKGNLGAAAFAPLTLYEHYNNKQVNY